ncbi:hypothetical protein CEXT_287561 [Caerostris extrusa]|uniref:Uncharacterized protein n=1 Tax=Caerostris extrusa TaxID=172846 RepID=A0AAV4QA16_CAEEX|nr:hypothetical protein CEXT_287561 [Caerostris extrusa]
MNRSFQSLLRAAYDCLSTLRPVTAQNQSTVDTNRCKAMRGFSFSSAKKKERVAKKGEVNNISPHIKINEIRSVSSPLKTSNEDFQNSYQMNIIRRSEIQSSSPTPPPPFRHRGGKREWFFLSAPEEWRGLSPEVQGGPFISEQHGSQGTSLADSSVNEAAVATNGKRREPGKLYFSDAPPLFASTSQTEKRNSGLLTLMARKKLA